MWTIIGLVLIPSLYIGTIVGLWCIGNLGVGQQLDDGKTMSVCSSE